MKAEEIIKLATLIAKKEDKPMRRRNPPKFFNNMNDKDLLSLLHKRIEEAQSIDTFLKEREKIGKKEEKKKEAPSLEQMSIFLVLTYPIIGLLLWHFHFIGGR